MATEEVNYGHDVAALSMSVYLEVMTILGAYRDSWVLVGGWAPYFILERFGREDDVFHHVGSGDLDIGAASFSVGGFERVPEGAEEFASFTFSII